MLEIVHVPLGIEDPALATAVRTRAARTCGTLRKWPWASLTRPSRRGRGR